MDIVSAQKRSEIMSRIRGANTSPERLVRSIVHRLGYRFRLHSESLPGRPDLVLPRHRTVIFVHGCFWHRHPGCRFAYTPKSRVEFWQRKFAANKRRDRQVQNELRKLGWRVVVVWECELRQPEQVAERLATLLRRTDSGRGTRSRSKPGG